MVRLAGHSLPVLPKSCVYVEDRICRERKGDTR
jgi:hypothetical protein